MLIAVQHAVFADDTQSIGIRLGIRVRFGIGIRLGIGGRSVQHFAAGIKLIVRGRQKVVGLGDPIDAVNHQLAAGAGVIVVAVKLEQTRIIAAAMAIS